MSKEWFRREKDIILSKTVFSYILHSQSYFYSQQICVSTPLLFSYSRQQIQYSLTASGISLSDSSRRSSAALRDSHKRVCLLLSVSKRLTRRWQTYGCSERNWLDMLASAARQLVWRYLSWWSYEEVIRKGGRLEKKSPGRETIEVIRKRGSLNRKSQERKGD